MYVNVGIDRAQVQTIFSDMRYFDISVFEMARVIVAASIREDGKLRGFPSQIIKGSIPSNTKRDFPKSIPFFAR